MPETYGLPAPWQPRATEDDLRSERLGNERMRDYWRYFEPFTPVMDWLAAWSGHAATLSLDVIAQRLVDSGVPRDRVVAAYNAIRADETAERDADRAYIHREPQQRPYNDPEPVTKRTGADTRFHEAHPDIPRHKPDRPSQTPVGRHLRYVRSEAARKGVTEAVADRDIQSHPEGCPFVAERDARKPIGAQS